ncbi:MAG: hypothetical protein JEZ06_15020 [Anaerolineaceae bacterium]|nr:hypothetical protein [Anaerolineaceae bacterium]
MILKETATGWSPMAIQKADMLSLSEFHYSILKLNFKNDLIKDYASFNYFHNPGPKINIIQKLLLIIQREPGKLASINSRFDSYFDGNEDRL